MPRDGRLCPVRWVDPDVMTAAVVVQEAPVLSQMPLELPAAHAERRRVDESFRRSLMRDVRRARDASCAIRNASSMDSASVTSSGSIGLVTTKPPSSAVVRVSTSLPSDTVYDFATRPL